MVPSSLMEQVPMVADDRQIDLSALNMMVVDPNFDLVRGRGSAPRPELAQSMTRLHVGRSSRSEVLTPSGERRR